MEMHAFGHLTPVRVARQRLLRAVVPIARTETVGIGLAFGRVSAEAVRAPQPVPSFARATWDGYALRSRDTAGARRGRPVELRVVGEVFAESPATRAVRRGEAMAIATGGAVPAGADTVVIFEEVGRTGDRVSVGRALGPGERISPIGDDFPRGTRLVATGEEFTPVTLGALAACGRDSVRVLARPIVAVVPNGNELLPAGARRRTGAIYESNNATLAAVILAAGGIPLLFPPVRDDPHRIERALREAMRRADLVLATGGSSVGERDFLPRIFPRLGRLLFHGIAVRPGKPTLAARSGAKVVIGLPGHPTSCLANMYWLGLPVLRRLAGRTGPGWVEGRAVLGADATAPSPGLSTVVPLAVRRGRVYPAFHGSATVTSLRGASAFAILPPGRRVARAGGSIQVCFLDPPLGRGVAPSSASTV